MPSDNWQTIQSRDNQANATPPASPAKSRTSKMSSKKGSIPRSQARAAPQTKSSTAALITFAIQGFLAYIAYLVLWVCPSSSDSAICNTVLGLKTKYLDPALEHDAIAPHVERAGALYDQHARPVIEGAYNKLEPQIKYFANVAKDQWDAQVQKNPYIAKADAFYKETYRTYVAPQGKAKRS